MATKKTQVVFSSEDGAILRAVEQLIDGELVAIPTETVYGVAADALNDIAVQQIYTAKGRPSNNPLICHVSSIQMADHYVYVNENAQKLMNHYWPGPLTLVLPRRDENGISDTVSAKLPTLAVRCPDNETTRSIIENLDRPIAAPSANPSGKLSPTTAKDVEEGLGGKIAMIIDGGSTNVGIESTIIGVEGDKLTLLRPGTLTAEDIAETMGMAVHNREDSTITAPGQLKSHYAPNSAVRLNALERKEGETLIGFGDVDCDFNLSPSGDFAEAARNLFNTLREADAKNTKTIAVTSIPNHGIGIALNDRLERAAAPRNN
ncbi:threonylcarbamoyl-AMP synthase [Kordiimonas sp. SCSIO 12603]|uniref:L-threonylcarbamoyladenylate synthase n=1 Tax=Kordiimonas sp. SCSIO 12603 TaxID=2829596 RepID=UPI002103A050|nr:L-threonylcarbamoyladenylate synthase [Kordiimonas sp. SCSIO 12603]UTW57182.1 threonylcarbamoyl-AMP synthase [Kordiimonas sp. SCSIO 12603]